MDYKDKNIWSAFSISRRLAIDSITGITAALSVAPIMMIIDKAVVQTSTNSSPIFQNAAQGLINTIRNPFQTIKSPEFKWIGLVYGSTYVAANTIDSLCKIYHCSDVIPKLVGVTGVNMTLCILKDRAYAKMFGNPNSSKVGMSSLGLWFVRDVLTISAAFVLPSRLSQLINNLGVEQSKANNIALFTLPIIFQLILTPIHLLGYDYYNFPVRKFKERVAYILPKYWSTTSIRMIRMGAAYGLGGLGNKTYRNKINSRIEGDNWNTNY